MKKFLFFIILLLIAVILILNWNQREEIIQNVKQRFTKEQVECEIEGKYQDGKKWVQNKLEEI